MQKILKTFILIILLIIPFSTQVFAASTTDINQLVENAKALDGKQVTVQGEAIGEIMQRGDYCWVNINDTTNAMGIWMKSADARQITCYGNYKNKGDTIIVSGVFRRACSEHGGEADIHSETFKIVQTGHSVKEQIPFTKVLAAVILLVVLFASCFAAYHFKGLKIPSNR